MLLEVCVGGEIWTFKCRGVGGCMCPVGGGIWCLWIIQIGLTPNLLKGGEWCEHKFLGGGLER
jgi:hypothetical protein